MSRPSRRQLVVVVKLSLSRSLTVQSLILANIAICTYLSTKHAFHHTKFNRLTCKIKGKNTKSWECETKTNPCRYRTKHWLGQNQKSMTQTKSTIYTSSAVDLIVVFSTSLSNLDPFHESKQALQINVSSPVLVKIHVCDSYQF